ncbi:hypothetical protein SEA_KIKO_57 [Gordonia phage Kiko]|uniref:hypothetical protein n=1 Tax=Gordonia rubripertincta TaxID=36822 RepID=UPI000FDFA60C|nr:hypothetical protein [Gordonia rubripertincta]AZV00779.1 hypothetical protein SEA_KIKO_57 [Gordonia phage Kiko]QMU22521.1 hypothetical protein H3V45_08660 [Gordonia rubripertincta]
MTTPRVIGIRHADGTYEDLDALRKELADWRKQISTALGVKPGESNYALAAAIEKIRDLRTVDHTDPNQIRRAAGVIEGIGLDLDVDDPDEYPMSPQQLRGYAKAGEDLYELLGHYRGIFGVGRGRMDGSR